MCTVRKPFSVLLVHNAYGEFSGEEAVVESVASLLKSEGAETIRFVRNSSDIMSRGWWGSGQAFFSGVYCRASRRQIKQVLQEWRLNNSGWIK